VPRPRLRIMQLEGALNVLRQRAVWEVAQRLGRSQQVRVTVDRCRDQAGVLYAPNTVVDVSLPTLKLGPVGSPDVGVVTWTIGEVTYSRDESGTTCDLTISPPQTFNPEPVVLYPVAPNVVGSVGP
jgi:prophage tail gpP-like protein